MKHQEFLPRAVVWFRGSRQRGFSIACRKRRRRVDAPRNVRHLPTRDELCGAAAAGLSTNNCVHWKWPSSFARSALGGDMGASCVICGRTPSIMPAVEFVKSHWKMGTPRSLPCFVLSVVAPRPATAFHGGNCCAAGALALRRSDSP